MSKQFTIFGNTPSKSNCYRIITFRSKDAKPTIGECDADGCEKGFKQEKSFFSDEILKVPCNVCHGTGQREILPAPRASLAKSAELKKYEKSFIAQWGKIPFKVTDEFEIHVDVYYPTKRSDLDNSLKVLLDCLQEVGAIPNDNLCLCIVAHKFVDKEKPRIEFTISPM